MTLINANRIQKPNISQVIRQEDLIPSFNKLVEAILPLVGQNQDKLETAVTFKDLQAGGFPLAFNNAGLPSIGGGVDSGDEELPNMSKPPAMTGVVFSSTTRTIIMAWNPPTYSNHSFVEIWRAPAKKEVNGELVDTGLSDATYLSSCLSVMYADTVFPSESWRYFLRNVSQTGVKGDWHNNDGTVAASADDPRYILDRIEGAILEGDLSKELGDKVGALDTMWTVKIDAGNAVAGIGLGISDEGQTEFIVRAHRFAVVPPQEFDVDGKPVVGDDTIPFYVVEEDGKWYTRIKNAVIDEAFIDSLVASGITADRVNALNLNAVNITGGSINIGGRFSVNSNSVSVVNATLNCNNRFVVSPDGVVTIRDSVNNVGLKISNSRIDVYDGSGVLRVRMGYLP